MSKREARKEKVQGARATRVIWDDSIAYEQAEELLEIHRIPFRHDQGRIGTAWPEAETEQLRDRSEER